MKLAKQTKIKNGKKKQKNIMDEWNRFNHNYVGVWCKKVYGVKRKLFKNNQIQWKICKLKETLM